MIDKQTLTAQWFDKVSKANRNSSKSLVEKVIRALLLLEGLANSEIKFVFKGGTALMLLLNSARRLSIDIDIVISDEPKNLKEIFDDVAKSQGFNKCEEQERITDSAIKKAHYKFFYTPVHKTNQDEEHILLDILFEANHYAKISAIEIASQFVHTTGKNATVNVPSFEDLLGDKLTAFAPNTTGIPYFKNDVSRSMEIIKQLYDIGHLFDFVEDVETIKTTFRKIAIAEIAYRNFKGGKPEDVLEDIYQTALCLSLHGQDGKGNYEQLHYGTIQVAEYIFSEDYHLNKAIPHAAKAAYLSRIIATNQKEIEKFKDPQQVAEAFIQQPHNTKLNKIKKSSPEAFFYWWKATLL